MRARTAGSVYGVAGGSLAGASFGQRGAVGQQGEAQSARIFTELAGRGPDVIHDLRIPIPGFRANIDHAIVSGRDITLVDTKVWRSGFYWTLGGTTRRGLDRAEHCDKKTLPTGVDAIRRHFDRLGVNVSFRQSVLLVWTPGRGRSNYLFYRPNGARVIHADDHASAALARHAGTKPADPQVASTLATLIYR